MRRTKVLHLIDDTTAGGVTRVVDHITGCRDLARFSDHAVTVDRGGWWSLRASGRDVIVSHLSVNWRNLPRLLALRLLNPTTRLIHVEHSYTEAFVRLNVAHKARFRLLLWLGYRLFDRVAAVSEGQQAWLKRIAQLGPDRLFLLRSHVDLSSFSALTFRAAPPRVIGAIGRLEPQKGFDRIIKAVRSCTRGDLELHIYGTGAEEEALKALAAEDPRIRFHGFAADPVAALRDVDAVVMPSRWEAYGLVACEALAAGRPLFVSDIDGLRDHLRWGAVAVTGATPNVWRDLLEELPGRAWPRPAPQMAETLQAEFVAAWKAVLA